MVTTGSATVQLIGTGGYLPGEPIDNARIESLAGALPEDVVADIGIQARHWIVDPASGAHREGATDMAVAAADRALAAAGVGAEQVDLLVVATATPEYPLPPMANLLQERLGTGVCTTWDLRSAGAGAVQAIEQARLHLLAGSSRTALVIGVEATSPALVPIYQGKDPGKVRIRDRIPMYMFGDGAGAVVLQREESSHRGGGILASTSAAIGPDRPPGIQVVGGGTHAPIHEQVAARRLITLKVDVVSAGHFAPSLVAEAIGETLEAAGVGAESVDVCVVPEGSSGWMQEAFDEGVVTRDEWAKVSGRFVDSLATRGALGCAGPLICLDDAVRSEGIAPGSKVLLVGIESTKWVYAGVLLDWPAPAGTAASDVDGGDRR